MIDSPMSHSRYRRERLMQLWDESGVPMKEVREAYPEHATRAEWEAMLDRCAERGEVFPAHVLRGMLPTHQHGINRRSKGASIPTRFVLSPIQAPVPAWR